MKKIKRWILICLVVWMPLNSSSIQANEAVRFAETANEEMTHEEKEEMATTMAWVFSGSMLVACFLIVFFQDRQRSTYDKIK